MPKFPALPSSNMIREALTGRRKNLTDQQAIEVVAKAIRGGLPPGALQGSENPAIMQQIVRDAASQLAPQIGQTPDDVEAALISQGLSYTEAFAPGRPLNPYFGYDKRPRSFNYAVGRNISTRPRQSRVPFEMLLNLINSYDIAQICIRHIIDDLRSMPLLFSPINQRAGDVSDQIEEAKKFWSCPDGENDWPEWLGLWMQDLLRFDGGVLYKRRSLDGKLIAVEVVDTKTIAPLVDYYGRKPQAPAPAYLQFVQGLPWDWLTKDEVIYTRFNPIPEDVYGVAPIEAVMLTANTDIRFQWHFLKYFTEGTVPEGFMQAPPDQSEPDAIQQWQEVWDAWLSGDQGQKHRIRWVPHGSEYQAAKNTQFDSTFPTYLLRRTVASFGLTPQDLGFTEDVNRSTGDTQMDVQFRISTLPKSIMLEHVLNRITRDELGLQVKMSFDTGREREDRLMEAQAHQIYVSIGAESPDEVRRDVLGLEVNPTEMIPRGIITARLGFLPLSYVVSVSGEVDEATGAPVPGTTELVDFVLPGTPGPDVATGKIATETAVAGDVPSDDDDPDAPPTSDGPVAKSADQSVVCAGLAVVALDTGRILMLQRSITDSNDPAAGTWEFPGGHIEDGETPMQAACREWQEETACILPDGMITDTWISPNGVYQGFVCVIESEDSININPDNNAVINPDDPDGDDTETTAWWDPADASSMTALRTECRLTPWTIISATANAIKAASIAVPQLLAPPAFDEEAVRKVVRQWRTNSRNQVRKGQAPRRFSDPEIPSYVVDYVWEKLEGATTREQVDLAFSYEGVAKASDGDPKAEGPDRAVEGKTP